jgi:hypothetical protein
VHGSEKDMRRLLADPGRLCVYPLKWAVKAGNIDAVRVLLEDGRYNPSKNCCDSVFDALQCEDDHILRLLFKDSRVYRYRNWLKKHKGNRPCPGFVSFLQRERVGQSLCVTWVGIQVGQGWKDLSCDILVQYIGSLYET